VNASLRALTTAASLLAERDAVALFALADAGNVAFYAGDAHTSPSFVRDVFPDAASLAAALRACTPVALRSALALLGLVDPRAAGPLVLAVIDSPAPPDLGVARYVALGQFAALATLDEDTALPLLERPDMNGPALADALVAARADDAAKQALLRGILRRGQTQRTWELAVRLAPAATAEHLRETMDGADAAWAKWAQDRLWQLEDPVLLERAAAALDGAEPGRAISALLMLGPERAEAPLLGRYFTEGALATDAGRDSARAVLHALESRILLKRDARWKTSRAFRDLADRLRDDETPLGRKARSLAAVLRGKRPIAETPGSRPKKKTKTVS
jgi:hypothetical protein